MATIRDLVQADSQTRLWLLQVYRNNTWVTLPFQSANGTIGLGKGGKVDLVLPDNAADASRSQMYEGEKVRMYRGVLGAPLQRCWTGYVDYREPIDSADTSGSNGAGVSRNITVTDYIKELNDAILVDGRVYDSYAPNAACIDVIQRTIATGQFTPTDDAGTPIVTLPNYNLPAGNALAYFPDLLNDDGTTFVLPSGTLASFTNANGQMASFSIPPAGSGSTYSVFELPKRAIIASTMVMPGFTMASLAAFPPASGHYFLDSYNGLLYFNPSDASTTVSFAATYFDSPLFDYPAGRKAGDVIASICDKVGAHLIVTGSGQIQMVPVDTVRSPKRIFTKAQYAQNGVEINRDRRNVIVCLGWDGDCGGILVSKAILNDDIVNPPPLGLGKRTYLLIQDPAWKTQYAVNKAAYYAAQQVGRRGKIMTAQILDDPTLNLDDAIAFQGTIPELDNGDFFYIEQLRFVLDTSNGTVNSILELSGTLLPGQGTIYLGPITGVTALGSLDYSQDVKPITNCHLSPAGGSYNSTFSIATGLNLVFTIGTVAGTESIDVYGSDGSHLNLESNVARAASQTLTLPLSFGPTAGVLYVVVLQFRDNNGNRGTFRSFITARP